jgi:hypothetical protein
MQHNTTSPIWNETLFIREGNPGAPFGFIFVSIIDDQDELLERFSFPVKFLEPFRPINLQVDVIEG